MLLHLKASPIVSIETNGTFLTKRHNLAHSCRSRTSPRITTLNQKKIPLAYEKVM